MLIDSMIRLGRPMVEGGLDPEEVIRQISSITEDRSKGFFEHIIIAEVKSGKVFVHQSQIWGHYEKKSERSQKEVFFPDVERAMVAPFIVPSGGNPTAPQGKYAVPSYIVYDRQLRIFQDKTNEMVSFLSGRIERTIGIQFDQELVEKLAKKIKEEISKLDLTDKRKHMGLIILVFLDEDSPYTLMKENVNALKQVGKSISTSEKYIYANLEEIMNRLWLAKIEEGADKGKQADKGCFFCFKEGEVVSLYNKANPWFTTTWEAPLPFKGSTLQIIDGIALCDNCYKYLSYGANVFSKLTKRMDNWLTKELFAPNTSVKARTHYTNSATIYGGVLPLPLSDDFFENSTGKDFYVKNIGQMMIKKGLPDEKENAQLYLKTVTGIEAILPEDFLVNNYRLALIYFTGDVTRGDIHLLSYIEDILPSTARMLSSITEATYNYARKIAKSFPYELTDQKDAYMERRYCNLPYLLSVAYGSPYLWDSLETVFHRRPLSETRFIKNVSSRFDEMSRDLEENIFKINDETVFYLSFKYFMFRYNEELFENKGGENVRNWQTLLKLAYETPIENIDLELIEEIGFLTGALMRRFANHYYYKTKANGNGKDFIKHRVMTFGSSLTPDNVWKRGLSKIEEYDRRLDMGIAQDLRDRVAIVSMVNMNKKDDIFKRRDDFMAAFWAGYALFSTVKKSIDISDNQEGI